jgi:hypothetical protein
LEAKRLVRLAGVSFFVSLASAVIFCYGCTAHEESRRGPQDYITHLLALGTYFSLMVTLVALAALIVGIVVTKRNPQ